MASTAARSQFYKNTLQPIPITELSLKSCLKDLQTAIEKGVDIIASQPSKQTNDDGIDFGHIFSGELGIALMGLRLQEWAKHNTSKLLQKLQTIVDSRVDRELSEADMFPGRMGILCSPSLGAIFLRLMTGCPIIKNENDEEGEMDDITTLEKAVNISLEHGPLVSFKNRQMGGDEILYGRAGLLWALLNIRHQKHSSNVGRLLEPVLATIPKLIEAIVNAGKTGATDYDAKHGGDKSIPLMWPWIGSYYGLGAVHGIVGILIILLQCSTTEIKDYISLIAGTVTAICQIVITNNGHLPLSTPDYPSSSNKEFPLVQICHGAPGHLLLMGILQDQHNPCRAFWQPSWTESVQLATTVIWEQGLLSKGGGLCHGLAGNAWPWLISSRNVMFSNGSTKGSDEALSLALAFLLETRFTQPFSSAERYRLPDAPLSMFEGLAGTVCAWSEACIVIEMRLHEMKGGNGLSVAYNAKDLDNCLLGVPGLGGYGVRGFL